ncbi:agmatine deiminase family protein [uncultured Pontibacter sp.]|uniref:agmatine deiminase family protein n=1 Tax=uncultured Pontibacter sp. TaxID=453356 RepID=UPI002628D8C2|nr:agmatine deiminase family protein [uncultured Pontibacter sp.]
MSDLLQSDIRFSESCNQLTALLDKYSIDYRFIKETKDIWCRDYMPIQTGDGQYVQFRYEPSYLKDDAVLQSDPKEVCEANGIKARFSNINLDGGNLVNWSDRAILTDRIFDENPEYSSKSKLISEIEELLEVEVIIIPQIKSDMTGHADGLIRFLDHNTLVGNDRNAEFTYWVKGIKPIIQSYGLDYIDIPFFEFKSKHYTDSAIGCYVNFLEVKDLIVVPIFEVFGNRDEEVVKLFKSIYPKRTIETINFNQIGLHGGLLNCTTWTIKE